jgi:hypothetical protein
MRLLRQGNHMIDSISQKLEPPVEASDTSTKLLADAMPGSTNLTPGGTSVPPDTLPSLTISNNTAPRSSGVRAVLSDLASGAWNEANDHPLNILFGTAIGTAAGLLAEYAGPEITIPVALAGAAFSAYELYKNVPTWAHDAKVVADPNSYSPAEVSAAHSGLQSVGAGAADLTAGALGGGITSGDVAALLASGDKEAADAAVTTTTTAETTAALPEAAAPVPPETVPSPASLPDTRAFSPFTVGNTTISIKNPAGWISYVDFNGDEADGAASLQFANRWGTLMQGQMAAGQPLTKETVLATRSQAGGDTLPENLVNQATLVLSKYWQYGLQLQQALTQPLW